MSRLVMTTYSDADSGMTDRAAGTHGATTDRESTGAMHGWSVQ